MTAMQWVGAVLLLAVPMIAFGVTVWALGWREALTAVSLALMLAGLTLAGLWLLGAVGGQP